VTNQLQLIIIIIIITIIITHTHNSYIITQEITHSDVEWARVTHLPTSKVSKVISRAQTNTQTSWLHRASIIFNTLISNWCTQR